MMSQADFSFLLLLLILILIFLSQKEGRKRSKVVGIIKKRKRFCFGGSTLTN